jgi:hypothetical protein
MGRFLSLPTAGKRAVSYYDGLQDAAEGAGRRQLVSHAQLEQASRMTDG